MFKESIRSHLGAASARKHRLLVSLLAIGSWLGLGSTAQACGGIAGATSPAFCFVSQIGGCAALPAFLAANQPALAVTLVVDGQCGPYAQTLTLPGRMTLAGVGRDGSGELLFQNLGANQPALAIAAGQGFVQIRDVVVRNVSAAERGIGLRLHGNHQITLDRVRIDRFNIGVEGRQAYSVLINGSNISNNGTNLMLGLEANSWRVRDNILSRALGWGVVVRGPNNDVLLDGNRMESNLQGAVRLYSYGTIVSNNRFEFNGAGVGNLGVDVRPSAQDARILHNFFSSDTIGDGGVSTRCAFNLNVVEPASCL